MGNNTPTTLDQINQNDELAKKKLDSLKQYFVAQLHRFFNDDMNNMTLKDLNKKYHDLYLQRGENTKLGDNIIARLSSCMTLNSLKKYGKEFTHYNPEDAEESIVLTECIRRVLSIGLQELKAIDRESQETKAIQIPNTPSSIENMFVGLKRIDHDYELARNPLSALGLATFRI